MSPDRSATNSTTVTTITPMPKSMKVKLAGNFKERKRWKNITTHRIYDGCQKGVSATSYEQFCVK